MLSLQQISDRLEIQQLFVDYSSAIDSKNFDALDTVFTPDAYIDYRAMGGIDGRYPQIKAWLAQVLPNFPAYFHLVGNAALKIEGDAASSTIICFKPDAGEPARGQAAGDVPGPVVPRQVGAHRAGLAHERAGGAEVF